MTRSGTVCRGFAVPTLLLVLVLGAGCAGSAPPRALPPAAERVPVTERAIAAVMLDHLPDDTTDRAGQYVDTTSPEGLVGAELRYHGGPGEDGDLVRASLTPGDAGLGCPPQRCAELDTGVEGAVLQVRWDTGSPEEEPGVVGVLLQRADEYTYVSQSGPLVSGDPRELDLEVTVDDMVAIAEDPWLRLETSPDAVRAGEELTRWSRP